jgi:hypothetical protein
MNPSLINPLPNRPKGGNTMKKYAFFAVIAAFLLSGCKTQQTASVAEYDDAYYKPKKVQEVPSQTVPDEDLTAPRIISTPDSSAAVAPESTGWYDDYNDYTARIKHFQYPAENAGYFDEVYADSTEQAEDLSGAPDVNISLGFGWGCGWDYSWGWGYPYTYYGWNYPYYYSWYSPWWWYYPYYPWPYPGDYWYGYWNGYWDGYYGYYPYPYPYYNYYNTYYGPRRTLADNDGAGYYERSLRNDQNTAAAAPDRSGRTESTIRNERSPGGDASVVPSDASGSGRSGQNTVSERADASGQRVEQASNTRAEAAVSARAGESTSVRQESTPAVRSDAVKSRPDQQRYTYTLPNQTRSASYQRSDRSLAQNQKPAPRYVRPGTPAPASRSANTQVYSSPSYRQPKSSQEYLNPRPQGTSPANNAATPDQRRSYSTPSQQRTYSTPSQNRSNTRSYSSPSNTPRSYSSPSRSYSSPSYSSPSRSYSSPSYSAPSRSGGGSGSSGGGGSRSGGGGGGSRGGGGGGGRR